MTLHPVDEALRRSEEALRASEERLRVLLDQVPAIVWTTDTALCFTSGRGGGLAALGLRPEQLIGVPVATWFGGAEAIAVQVTRRALGGESISFPAGWNGRTFEARIEPLLDGSGAVIGTIGAAFDVTGRQATENELRASLNLVQAIVRGTDDVIFVKDENGRYILVNQAFESFLGRREADIIGRVDEELFAPEYAARFREADARAIATGEVLTFEETTVVGGVSRTHWGSKFTFRDAAGRPVGVVGIARDITERKRMEEALREAEARFRRMVETSPDGILVHRVGTVLFANGAMVRILGLSDIGELLGRSILDFVLPEDLPEVRARLGAAEAEGRPAPPTLRQLMRADGTLTTVEVAVEPTVWEGAPAVQSVVRDVTGRLRAEEALRESEERYALAAAAANDGLWDWELRNNRLYVSSRWMSMLGEAPEATDTTPHAWLSRVHPDDLPSLQAEIDAHLEGHKDHLESTHRMRHADGGWRWMLARGLAVRGADGRATRMAGSQTDVTERKLAEEQLLHDALHDALTGLPNRALFNEELRLAIDRRRRRPDYGFTVLFLDLDRFKVINDSLGHLAGDQLLVELSARLQRCLRPGDRVARLGGDEFTILLDDMDDVPSATGIADRIQVELEAPFSLSGREVFTSASIGIALSRTGYLEPEAVLRDADLAMYRAKGRGGSRYEVFDLGMHASAVARLELETDLRRAIERQEFRLYYQPIFDIDGVRPVGFEALVRWQHPRRGLIDPAAFIGVAEETNLTVLIGRYVMLEACRQLAQWRERYGLGDRVSVGVNVSGRQLLAPGLAQEVARALRETGTPPAQLTLEITENVLMQDAETSADVLAALEALGVHLHMDDFGTGYSSLSYLRRFPLRGLKIDRFFVSRMDEPDNLELVRTIVGLARNLGLLVVAEGVEHPRQWAELRAMGCQYVQGFLFSPPVTADEAEALLKGTQGTKGTEGTKDGDEGDRGGRR